MLRLLQRALNDDAWKYPIVIGIMSIPATIGLQRIDAVDYVLLPPFFAGILVGLWSVNKVASSKRVGWRTGLIGGIAILYRSTQFSTQLPSGNQPIFATAFAVASLLFVTTAYVVVYGILGAIGSLVGERISKVTSNKLGNGSRS